MKRIGVAISAGLVALLSVPGAATTGPEQVDARDVSGKTFDDLARAELFEPLGMASSSFASVPPAQLLDRPTDLARLLASFSRSFRGDATTGCSPGRWHARP
jgi:hypothetical protein